MQCQPRHSDTGRQCKHEFRLKIHFNNTNEHDSPGSVLHGLVSSEESDRDEAAVAFTFMHMGEERVVEMIDPRPSAECKKNGDASGCDISFDPSQLTAFIDEQVAMQSVTLLLKPAAAGGGGGDSEDDEAETALPEEVQELLADESTAAFVVAFVSPAAVQKLLATSDLASVSDMRTALLASPQFADLVLKFGQVVTSGFSALRGIVDIQGN